MTRLLLLLALFAAGCADAEVGAAERPFTMYFVPSVDTEGIATGAQTLTDFVARRVSRELYGNETSFHIESAVPASYVAVVEAFGTKRADFAAVNVFSYVLAKDIKHYPVEAVLSVIRGDGETSYKAQILARADSGIDSLEDLNGKSFAFTDRASMGGYILPAKLLNEKGIELGNTVFAKKHDNVVTMVYQGQVDAGATYYSPPRVEHRDGREVETIRDARARVLTQFPDVARKVKIVAFTDSVHNEPWIIRSNLYSDPAKDAKVREAVVGALLEFAATDEGKQVLESLYNISGLQRTNDAEYEDVRRMIVQADLDLEAELK